MADLIRRPNDQNVPAPNPQAQAQAQRVVDALEKIAAGAGAAQPPAPAAPGQPPHQTVIYVSQPGAQAPAPAPVVQQPAFPQPPVEVHHHHTTVQESSPRRRGGMDRRKNTSALGVAAL